MPRALMIQGTASHVGKSVLTAAFGRWLRERGQNVAPFKAQNMSLNSFVTLSGEEIARSQATQAAALGLEPSADMNPVLLKPMERGCQVVVQGRGVGVMSIHEYYAWKPHAWRAITASYDRLAAAHEAIVLEGAGSPAEINLKANDLVNMRMAAHADAAVVLAADIERGGVFAQLIGTWELLDADERQRVAGFIINKFRGDPGLLRTGLKYVEQRTGRPVLGVLPFDPTVQLDEEDSLGVAGTGASSDIDVAVLRLPGLSNFTDFAALAWAPGVGVRYVSETGQLLRPDLLILPGTRTTLRALDWLRATGLAEAVQRLASDPRGPFILGLCGGCQLLGRTIHDPEGVETAVPVAGVGVPPSGGGMASAERDYVPPPEGGTPTNSAGSAGLGLLDIDTHFSERKTLSRVEGMVSAGILCCGCPVVGYEVHQGTSRRRDGATAWLRLRRQTGEVVEDGAVSRDGRIAGTYVHGLFDDARFCRALVTALRERRGLAPLANAEWLSQGEFWARRYARLGGWLLEHCDLRPVLHALGLAP